MNGSSLGKHCRCTWMSVVNAELKDHDVEVRLVLEHGPGV